jgi:glycosyltransferase involved in cell wall biosynthesis
MTTAEDGLGESARSSAGGRRILIDALAARFGGTAYAVIQIARELGQRPDVADVTVVARRGSIVADGLVGAPRVNRVTIGREGRFELVSRIGWEAARLPALVRGAGVDTVISMSGMVPRRLPSGLVCALFNPVMYERDTWANRIRRTAVTRTARRATLVVAPSEAMADLVRRSTGCECRVTPLGVDHDVFAPSERVGSDVLYVADFYAHKRHDLLLDTWRLLPEPRPTLRFVGNPDVDPPTFASVRARATELSRHGCVSFEHHLSLRELVRAYRDARVFVAPSEHESFCMPLVEAMACGVPAVVRDIATLREVGAGGARYVAGDDPAAWAGTLEAVLRQQGEHAQRARRDAVDAAARYSWRALADALITDRSSRDGDVVQA